MQALLGAAVFLLLSLLTAAHAASVVKTENVEAELLAETLDIAPGQSLWVALRKTIRPGWHTYWLNPGDSGEPTRIDWDLPPGFDVGPIVWPVPERIPVGPLMNFGFKGEIYLLTRMTAPPDLPPGQNVRLRAHVRWLVCEEICIPEDADFSLDLPVTLSAPVLDPVGSEAIARARAALPGPSAWPVTASATKEVFTLTVEGEDWFLVWSRGNVVSAAFFPEYEGLIDNAAPQQIRYGRKGFSISVAAGYKARTLGALPVEPVRGVVVVRQRDSGTGEVTTTAFTVEASAGAVPADTATYVWQAERRGGDAVGLSFGLALVFALVGGMLLNLMPCVLPVLSVKALSFVQSAQKHPDMTRRGGLAYSAGVILSFLVMAAVLLGLRALGQQIGWGFQLQSPAFVAVMAYLMFAIGLNLSGVFHVGQPGANIGGALADRGGVSGSFFTGVLASVVATPCTAPFMGAAVGFAVFQPSLAALAVFAVLGLGMALPYLALSFSPALGRLLPRPGVWMIRLKQGLAFPMYGTAAWLIWILTQQVAAAGILFVLAGLVLLGFAAWTFEVGKGSQTVRWRRAGRGAALASIVAALALVPAVNRMPSAALPLAESGPDGAVSGAGLSYEPYSPARLAALRAEGKTVFVNFTAAWCVTCLVNEQVALNAPSVVERFSRDGIVALKGDWTNRDPVITEALARYGRNGVPLYLLYPPGGTGESDAVVLPQILTPGLVLEALDAL